MGLIFNSFLESISGLLQAAPSPEDYLAATNSYLEVILTVTNNVGLSSTVSCNVGCALRDVEIISVPDHQTILVDNYKVKTPVEALGGDWLAWTNSGNQTQIVALSTSDDGLFFNMGLS